MSNNKVNKTKNDCEYSTKATACEAKKVQVKQPSKNANTEFASDFDLNVTNKKENNFVDDFSNTLNSNEQTVSERSAWH